MDGTLPSSLADQTILPGVIPLDQSEHFYVGPFEHFTLGRDMTTGGFKVFTSLTFWNLD
jgi:hypothetical protein